MRCRWKNHRILRVETLKGHLLLPGGDPLPAPLEFDSSPKRSAFAGSLDGRDDSHVLQIEVV